MLGLSLVFSLTFSQGIVHAEETESEEDKTSQIVGEEEVRTDDTAPEIPEIEGKGYEVLENTDENGDPFNPTLTPDQLEGKKQFLTFTTDNRQTYHVVVDYGKTKSEVYLLKAVNDEEIENLANQSENNSNGSTFNDTMDESEETESTEDSTKEEKNTQSAGIGSKVLIFVVVIGVMLGIYFFKKKHDDSSGFYDE